MDKPEKEYGDKKFSKTEMMKKPFQANRNLLSGVLKFIDAAIEKTEQLTADVNLYETNKTTAREKGNDTRTENIILTLNAVELERQYGAEVFEAYEQSNIVKEKNTIQKKIDRMAMSKSR